MRLKVNKIDDLEASILYEDLKDNINWKTLKKHRGIYKKAIKYLRGSSYEIYYSYNETNGFHVYELVWKPINGYNKSHRVVRLVLNEKDNLVYYGCNCDGFRRNKVCSHILATYIILKKQNRELQREIEEMVRSLRDKVREVLRK